MVFNKSGRMYKDTYMYDDQQLECVHQYKYLGIDFSVNGNFPLAKLNLKKKAMKATFKLKKLMSSDQLLPHESLKLFKRCIFPIGLYGSEIWGMTKHIAKNT